MKNINKIKRLIKYECTCHFAEQGAINHFCCMVDGVCLFFREFMNLPRCKYFESSVLPLEKELFKDYNIERKLTVPNLEDSKPRVKCKVCECIFEANSNRQQYCERCRILVKREQNRKVKQGRKHK